MQSCPLCGSSKGVKHVCEVCRKACCHSCCKRYLALADSAEQQVRTCNTCFLKNVAWDATRTHDVLGPADGTLVVLVHGALVGRQCLVLEARALAEAGFRVIVPDLPAHGSRFKETPLTLDNAVLTLHDVIQQEAGGQKVVLMGFSMGGYVAAAFAARHPELVCGVLMGACCHDAHSASWKMVGRLAELVYKLCSYKTKSQFMYKSFPEYMAPSLPDIQLCFTRAGAEFDSWQYTWRVMYDADMHTLLPQITCPALLVVGEQDFRDSEQKWLSLLPRGRLLVLPGGIHQFMFQPSVQHEWRTQAVGFATAAATAGLEDGEMAGDGHYHHQHRHQHQSAGGGGDGAVSSQTHPDSKPAGPAGAAPAPAAAPSPAAGATDGHQSAAVAVSAGKGGVGVGTVVSNLLAQLKTGGRSGGGRSSRKKEKGK